MKPLLMGILLGALAIASTGCSTFNRMEGYRDHGSRAVDDMRRIDVRGKATRMVEPDEINWTLTVNDQDPQLSISMERNENRTRDLLNLIRGLGIEPRDVKTHGFNIQKIYEHLPNGNQGPFKHYTVSRTIAFKQKDMSRYDEFLRKMVEVGGAEVYHSLGYSKQIEVTNEVRMEAVKAARKKAESMAELAGMRLGPAIHIEEYKEYNQPFYGNFSTNNVSSFDISSKEIQGATFSAGSMTIDWTIYATFEMLPAHSSAKRPSGDS